MTIISFFNVIEIKAQIYWIVLDNWMAFSNFILVYDDDFLAPIVAARSRAYSGKMETKKAQAICSKKSNF